MLPPAVYFRAADWRMIWVQGLCCEFVSSAAWAVQGKLTPFLRSCGYNPKKDVIFVPISGLFGSNIKERVDPKLCPWYTGGTLFEVSSGRPGPQAL